MSVDITLNKRKYRTRPIPKSVKNQKGGNGKRSRTGINWGKGSGLGDRNKK